MREWYINVVCHWKGNYLPFLNLESDFLRLYYKTQKSAFPRKSGMPAHKGVTIASWIIPSPKKCVELVQPKNVTLAKNIILTKHIIMLSHCIILTKLITQISIFFEKYWKVVHIFSLYHNSLTVSSHFHVKLLKQKTTYSHWY